MNFIAWTLSLSFFGALASASTLPVPPVPPAVAPVCQHSCGQRSQVTVVTPRGHLARILRENPRVKQAVWNAKTQTCNGQCGSVDVREMSPRGSFYATISCVRTDRSARPGRSRMTIEIRGLWYWDGRQPSSIAVQKIDYK